MSKINQSPVFTLSGKFTCTIDEISYNIDYDLFNKGRYRIV